MGTDDLVEVFVIYQLAQLCFLDSVIEKVVLVVGKVDNYEIPGRREVIERGHLAVLEDEYLYIFVGFEMFPDIGRELLYFDLTEIHFLDLVCFRFMFFKSLFDLCQSAHYLYQ